MIRGVLGLVFFFFLNPFFLPADFAGGPGGSPGQLLLPSPLFSPSRYSGLQEPALCRCEDFRPWREQLGGAIQSAGQGKGTSASCLFSLFNLIFKLKAFLFFFTSLLELPGYFLFFFAAVNLHVFPGNRREESHAGVA